MINAVTLVGRLTKDVDLRYTPNGKAVGNFTLAVNRPFKTNGQQETDFINCTIWGKQAENLANFMKKGSQVGVTGRIQTRTYENSEGKTVFVTEVVADQAAFLESKKDNQSSNQSIPASEGTEIQDTELPF
ncbi:single-stranded DNA-binding protein [Virgibacillus sp. C22-A2]|uniref:Single-stranded DNA-binding protein n=1 Tax=Virgibacillus tibetensis TaxID=3042313 RepID=A0ABU6K9T0_9BACI|nr:single-stranded DNA-binding protein [Virgibacillus sp. C22-A2]